MSSLAEIKKELQSYVAQAMEIEKENKSLKQKVESLENELKASREGLKAQSEKFEVDMKVAKDSWRSQAMLFSEKQQKLAYLECDNLIRQITVSNKSSDAGKFSHLFSSLLCAKSREVSAVKHSHVWRALALSMNSSMSTAILSDFDVVDCHISITNNGTNAINLSNYSIRMGSKESLVYKFSHPYTLLPGDSASVWWHTQPEDAAYRSDAPNGSFYWHSPEAVALLSVDDVAYLVDKSGRMLFSVVSNQAEKLPEHLNTGTVESHEGTEKPTPKRKRVDGEKIPQKRSRGVITSDVVGAAAASSSSSSSQSAIEYLEPFSGLPAHAVAEKTFSCADISILLPRLPQPSLKNRKFGAISIYSTDIFSFPVSEMPLPASTGGNGIDKKNDSTKVAVTSLSRLSHKVRDAMATVAGSNGASSKPATATALHVRVVINNDSDDALNLSGWSLLGIGYPLQLPLVLPQGAVIPANGQLFVTSYRDDDTDGNDQTSSPSDVGNISLVAASTRTVVVPDLVGLAFPAGAASIPRPRSVHLLDIFGRNVCEKVETKDLEGVFTAVEIDCGDESGRSATGIGKSAKRVLKTSGDLNQCSVQ